MPLSSNDRLGPYQILELIGAGGMGHVYRARDTRVGRDVAVKVSTEQFSDRFEREVRAIAALNHPNICTLYDVGPNYLVMEYVDGRSPSGPLPLDEALHIARQVADAVREAHDKGIVHRDLKPANIKIKPDGTVKVLDFGLAKLSHSPDAEVRPEDSPTLSMAATRAGIVLGTAAYMAPEQARGKLTDKRADIWAFGVVLYELLTGERLFKGEDITDTLASVVKERPDLSRVPPSTRRLLEKCLEKDPNKRLRDIGDAWVLLEDEERQEAATTPQRSRWGWIGLAAGVTIAAIALWAPWRSAPAAPSMTKFQIQPPPGVTFGSSFGNFVGVSPDGQRIAIVASGKDRRSRIWIRTLDSLEMKPLDGTDDAYSAFWSPDSRHLAFRSAGELKRIDITGGTPKTICVCLIIGLGSWSGETIIFGGPQGIMQVPASGGVPTPATVVDTAHGEIWNLFPSFLHDGRRFLYFASSGAAPDQTGMYVGSLDLKPSEQPKKRVLDGFALYSRSGESDFIFPLPGPLRAQMFDLDRLQPSGEPVTLGNVSTVFSSVSSRTLASIGDLGAGVQLTWFTKQGVPQNTVGKPGIMFAPAISPKDDVVAITDPSQGPGNLFLQDLKLGVAKQFTFDFEDNEMPIWSPDGSMIAYESMRGGSVGVYQRASNGVGEAENLFKAESGLFVAPMDWSRDGNFLLLNVLGLKTKSDIWILSLADKKAQPYVQSEYYEIGPRLSRDGRWLAYASNKTGRYEVYVETFTGGTAGKRGIWPVSANGGTRPRWSRNSNELFFVSADLEMMAVEFNSVGEGFVHSAPKALFNASISGDPWDNYDVSSDGRFLIPVRVQQSSSPITVLVDWSSTFGNR